MKLKTRRERVLLGLTLLVVIGSLGWVGYTRINEALYELENDEEFGIYALERELRNKQQMRSTSESVVKHYEEVKEQLSVDGETSLVKSFIREEVTELLNDTGFPAQTVLTQDPIPDREGFLTTYKVSIEGERDITIEQLTAFLYEMERRSEVLEIEQIQFGNPRQSREDPDGQYEFSVQNIVIERLVYSQEEES